MSIYALTIRRPEMKTNMKLVREQLQATLVKLHPVRNIGTPPKGWLLALRTALGMSGTQLARRIGVTRQRVSIMEKQEIDGSATLKTMRRNAEALDCLFVYAIVPKTSLEETIRNRARQVAVKRLAQASQTMALEDQALSAKENKKVLAEMVDDLVEKLPSSLWNES
jgi:predicted DNA-binding mobile mystery protein A